MVNTPPTTPLNASCQPTVTWETLINDMGATIARAKEEGRLSVLDAHGHILMHIEDKDKQANAEFDAPPGTARGGNPNEAINPTSMLFETPCPTQPPMPNPVTTIKPYGFQRIPPLDASFPGTHVPPPEDGAYRRKDPLAQPRPRPQSEPPPARYSTEPQQPDPWEHENNEAGAK